MRCARRHSTQRTNVRFSPRKRTLPGSTRMSALGQKQTFALQKVMSALPSKADMCSALTSQKK
jgi:hypothetical protein